ncbi:MAG: N-glycosylase/DNA lyase [Candidatus Methanomethyliaceae archaeon]|nr:N-glycosylase/DNA lyase [Candidatus Methanomethyliaceae archaeon]MDW7970486.1 N-glycosylase/DNA lyase [Nitrososphaerota archaeon]
MNFEAIKEIHERKFGKECELLSISKHGRVILVEFGGYVIVSCCAVDYFDDFAKILESLNKIPYGVFSVNRALDRFLVKIAELDFLDEIERAITKCKNIVDARIKEFEEIGKNEDSTFKELCFCILTANFSAKRAIVIQNLIGDGLINMSREKLYEKLIELGYLYPKRADYIIEAREYYGNLLNIIRSFRRAFSIREWLVENIKGLGYKEASHFLRNIGFKDLAIIDRHILRYLKNKELIEEFRILTRRRYLELESLLFTIADKLNITPAELDLYIWYLSTGEILK